MDIEQGYYVYENAEMARQAILELERIERLEKQIDYDKPQLVYHLYQKVIDKGIFHTPEGFIYLVHLRKYLEEHESELGGPIAGIPAGLLPLLPIDDKIKVQRSTQSVKKVQVNSTKEKVLGYRIVILFLIAAIIGMFIISSMSDSPTILNYEQEIQNKYVDWEEQLEEREAQLADWEKELEEEQEQLEK